MNTLVSQTYRPRGRAQQITWVDNQYLLAVVNRRIRDRFSFRHDDRMRPFDTSNIDSPQLFVKHREPRFRTELFRSRQIQLRCNA